MTPRNTKNQRQMLSRREFLRLTGLAGGAAFLASCAPSLTSTNAPTSAPATEAATAGAAATSVPATAAANAGSTTLAFWTPGGSDTFCGTFNDIATAYTKLDPNVTITAAKCYKGDQSFNEVLIANVASGTPPDASILWTSPAALAARGALEPIDSLMTSSTYSKVSNWPAGVLSSCQFKGQTYGLPVTAGSYGLFFNQDLLASKGMTMSRADFPKSWADLRKLSKELTTWDGDTLKTAGFLPFSNPGDVGSMAVELAIWSALNGSQLFDPATLKYTIDSEQNIEMMQFALDWYDEQFKGDLVKVRASGNWGGYADDQGRPPAFQEGNLAVMTNGFWFTGDLYSVDVKFKNWDVAPFPVGPSGSKVYSGYWPNWLVIPKGAPHEAAAFKYMDYIAGEGVKLWFSRTPDMPTNTSVATDTIPQSVVDKRGKDFATDITSFFRKQFDVAAPMWNSPIQDFGNDQIGRAAEQILSKAASVKDALTEAQKTCQAELDKTLKS